MKISVHSLFVFLIVNANILFAQPITSTHKYQSRGEIKIADVYPLAENFADSRLLDSDTLKNFPVPSFPYIDFGIFPQEIVYQWFVAPAKLKIKSIGIPFFSNPDSVHAEVKLVKFVWNISQLDDINLDIRIGYFQASGNGYNNINAFWDNPDRTGDWVDFTSNSSGSPFGEDIWSSNGVGISLIPNNSGSFEEYTWIEMNELNDEPIIEAGEVFGIAVKNTSENFSAVHGRIGVGTFQSLDDGILKFYANGRIAGTADMGWWKKDYTLDAKVAVEYLETPSEIIISDIMKPDSIVINSYEQEISAVISAPENLIGSIKIKYRENTNIPQTNVMNHFGNGLWKGNITLSYHDNSKLVNFKIEVNDTNGSPITSSQIFTYASFISNPDSGGMLLVFNGFNSLPNGWPQDYYFGTCDFTFYNTLNFSHDVWAFGPLPFEIANYYKDIVEITHSGNGPENYNDDVIRAWLQADPYRLYVLAGQEWLGKRYNYVDQDFGPGSFEYDILGITHSYNDVSLAGSTGATEPSLLIPVDDSKLGDSLFTVFSNSGSDSLRYDPLYESGNNILNKIDAFDIRTGVKVDMFVETRGINNIGLVDTLPVLIHRQLPFGNNVAFFGYDPLFINTSNPYVWSGFCTYSPQCQIFYLMQWTMSVREEIIPGGFSLNQNYPNPFNPATTINFNLPVESKVTLKIFDLLGQEVITLIDNSLTAGNHQVKFNAGELNSGIYFYQIYASGIGGQEFKSGGKMMLIK